MNFSRLVNSYRLRELEKLRIHPGYSGLSGLELIPKAGFSNFSGYWRIEKEKKEQNRLRW